MITKFQFSTLFVQAWSKGLTIKNILLRFLLLQESFWINFQNQRIAVLYQEFQFQKIQFPLRKPNVIEDSAFMKKADHDMTIKLYVKRLENRYDFYANLNM